MVDTLFLTPAIVKSRMAISSEILGIDTVINSAIRASQLRIAAELDSCLELTEFTDIFYLDSNHMAGLSPGGLSRMQLRSGLVRADSPAPVVTTGPTWSYCTAVVSADQLLLDLVKGTVAVDAETFEGQYVKVTYTVGYNDTDTLPSWLSEAILAYVPSIATFGSPTVESGDAGPTAKLGAAHALAVISPYCRQGGLFFRPIF
jgi:hypothetical protein